MLADVPFRGAKNEIGLLADALDVFRENANTVATSKANMSAVVENLAESIVMFSKERRVVLHNRRFARMMEMPDYDCVGMTSTEIVHVLVTKSGWPADTVHMLQARLAAMGGRAGSATFDIDLSDGRSFDNDGGCAAEPQSFVVYGGYHRATCVGCADLPSGAP